MDEGEEEDVSCLSSESSESLSPEEMEEVETREELNLLRPLLYDKDDNWRVQS